MITLQVSYYNQKMQNLQNIETLEKAKNSYLRFKTITSQDVSSKAQVKIFLNL